ncbi:AAA family ATPase [Massilibacterium senegalense]|uniref:AAA family ATPase n=1 Tax=Massilibacterium senegalense TaxID=1632858 RepID=UPI000A908CA9|nr:MoxR family ATPase [Massilibacterium senegalense]
MRKKSQAVIEEIEKVMVGKDDVIKKVWMSILAKGHILLEDIPGVGKTTLALTFSKALGLDFKRIQFTPDVVASDVIGFTMYDKQKETFVYKEGAVMCHLLLADEINRTTSRTQAALLEAMEESKVTVDGITYELPKPFIVIATQNPFGSYGTQFLPQSQLDRFMMKLQMGYPDFQSQVEILRDRQDKQPLDSVVPVLTKEELINMQNAVNQVFVADEILEYITHLTEATRNHELILQGISPRGALSINRLAKAHAFVNGRDYVIPEDVIEIFIDAVSHRIILEQKSKVANHHVSKILKELLEGIKTPDSTKIKN